MQDHRTLDRLVRTKRAAELLRTIATMVAREIASRPDEGAPRHRHLIEIPRFVIVEVPSGGQNDATTYDRPVEGPMQKT